MESKPINTWNVEVKAIFCETWGVECNAFIHTVLAVIHRAGHAHQSKQLQSGEKAEEVNCGAQLEFIGKSKSARPNLLGRLVV